MSSESSTPDRRRRKEDRVLVEERNDLAETMPADADLIQVVAHIARQSEANRRTQSLLFWMLAGTGVLVLLCSVTVIVAVLTATQTNSATEQIQKLGVSNNQILKQTYECNTPGQACYEGRQKAVADARDKIASTSVAVGVCLLQGADEKALPACVDKFVSGEESKQ